MDQTLMLRIRERAYHIWAATAGSGTELAEGRDGNTQQFTCSIPKSSASKKAARHFPESEENGFGGAGGAVSSAADTGKFTTITPNRVLGIGGASISSIRNLIGSVDPAR